MKKYCLIVMICFGILLLNSCERQHKICACGVNNPAKKIPWIAELIKKAKNVNANADNYPLCIWLENYKGEDIFVIDMIPGHSTLIYWYFDCSGNIFAGKGAETAYNPLFKANPHAFFIVDDEADFINFTIKHKLDVIIYSTPSYIFPY